jgi:type IV secretion system protein VirB6
MADPASGQLVLVSLLSASDNVTEHFLSSTYPALGSALSGPVYYAAILYWVLYGYQIYAGQAGSGMQEMLTKAITTALVLGTLAWGGLAAQIYHAFVGFMEGGAATLISGEPTATLIDGLYKTVNTVAKTLMKADWQAYGVIIQGFGLFLINCLLLLLAIVYMTIAKFGLAITMVLLPIFVAFLMWPQTRQWFMNWVSKMLNFALIYILVMAIVRVGFVAFSDAIDAVKKASTIGELDSLTGQLVSQLIIVEGVLCLFMLQVKSWAAALAGGATVQGFSMAVMAWRNLRGWR